ncbi:MAG TPA: glycosyltransferase [Flavobacterium sp.]|nr:glycosyltransferase [Flavobacterium sp.]
MPENPSKNILVAPLNWGLGHATRCIPIIKALEEIGFTPILASDGVALDMLKKEFPHLKALELPSYEIEYAKNGANFKWKMLKNVPNMIEAVVNEKKMVKGWVKEYNLSGIISDNRLGVVSKKIPSVFITHQLNVLTGNTTWLSGKLHRLIIKKFAECWVPDVKETPNLTGKLGHLKNPDFDIRYIGPLSRFEKKSLPKKYDLMIILSGPEPQRGILENLLQTEALFYNGKVIFIKGIVEAEQKTKQVENVTFYNFMTTSELEQAFNESKIVLCRSGYTTIMDLAKLGKKAFFIPTPGQYEQEYLAKKLKKEQLVPFAKQEDFRIENLMEIDSYQGLPTIESDIHWKNLFCLFEG